ncbi:hypothetical protein F4780DRAFT_292663 [Xylariomycetidae sp. FL0641]|nr:hypothetical protein F4780DRAFT_292663 [Xylariomycetidae sp. FL0641]
MCRSPIGGRTRPIPWAQERRGWGFESRGAGCFLAGGGMILVGTGRATRRESDSVRPRRLPCATCLPTYLPPSSPVHGVFERATCSSSSSAREAKTHLADEIASRNMLSNARTRSAMALLPPVADRHRPQSKALAKAKCMTSSTRAWWYQHVNKGKPRASARLPRNALDGCERMAKWFVGKDEVSLRSVHRQAIVTLEPQVPGYVYLVLRCYDTSRSAGPTECARFHGAR